MSLCHTSARRDLKHVSLAAWPLIRTVPSCLPPDMHPAKNLSCTGKPAIGVLHARQQRNPSVEESSRPKDTATLCYRQITINSCFKAPIDKLLDRPSPHRHAGHFRPGVRTNVVFDDPDGPSIAVNLPLRQQPLTPCRSCSVSLPLWIVNRRSLKAMSQDTFAIAYVLDVSDNA